MVQYCQMDANKANGRSMALVGTCREGYCQLVDYLCSLDDTYAECYHQDGFVMAEGDRSDRSQQVVLAYGDDLNTNQGRELKAEEKWMESGTATKMPSS